MSSDVELFRKLALSFYTLPCCPYCGARLVEMKSNICSSCGMEISSSLIRGLMRAYMVKKISANVMAPKIEQNIMGIDLSSVSLKLSRVMDAIERKIFAKYKEEIERAKDKKDVAALRETAKEIRAIKEKIMAYLRDIQTKQINAVMTDDLSALEEAYRALSNFKKELSQYVDPEILGAYVIPQFTLKIAEKYYLASRFNDAIRWYGAALTANLFPESSPNGRKPLYISGSFIPFGAIFLESNDVDFDGIVEIFYVPSREAEGMDVPCSIINEMGNVWAPYKGYEALVPRFGRFGTIGMIVVGWESVRMVDAKILNVDGNDVRIVHDGDTYYTLPAYQVKVFDVDADGYDEVIITSTRGRMFLMKHTGNGFEANSIVTGNVVDFAVGVFPDGNKIIALTVDGRLVMVDPKNIDMDLILRGIADPLSAIITVGDLDNDGVDEIYVNSSEGTLKVLISDGEFKHSKIHQGNILGCYVDDIDGDNRNELILMELVENGIKADIYELKEFLDMRTFNKVGSLPVSLGYNGVLRRSRIDFASPFYSRMIFEAIDVDGDGVKEVFIGLDKVLVSLDLKYD